MTPVSNLSSKWNHIISVKSNRIIIFALIGVITFLFVYGPRTLDVTYTDWLTNGKDGTLHFLGWDFFRHDPWAFPLGKITSYGYPFGSSTTGTDSITLLAIIFKLFNPILPQEFQYFGWWTLFCFAMQGIFGGLLLSHFARERASKNNFWIFMGTLFFTLSPIMLRPSHTALCGHWIILFSLYLFFKAKDTKISVFLWILVNSLATFIMPYFTLMTFTIYIGYEIDDGLKNKKLISNFARFIAVIAALVLCGWLIGLFDIGASSTSRAQFGYYSMNLNALFNPMGWSSFIKILPTATNGQTAGFNYLGLGMMIVLTVSMVVFIYTSYKRRLFPWGKLRNGLGLFFIIISLLLFSLSNKVTFFSQVILEVPLPEKILDLCAIFRSSGRIFWPVYYLIYLFALGTLLQRSSYKNIQKTLTIFLAIMLVVQIADMANSPLLNKKLQTRSKAIIYQSPLQSDFWSDAAPKYRHIVFLPPQIEDYHTFAFYAIRNQMTLNTGYFARAPLQKINQYANQLRDDLKRGVLDKNILYIIKDPKLFSELSAIYHDQSLGYVYQVDNFNVLVADPFPGKISNKEIFR